MSSGITTKSLPANSNSRLPLTLSIAVNKVWCLVVLKLSLLPQAFTRKTRKTMSQENDGPFLLNVLTNMVKRARSRCLIAVFLGTRLPLTSRRNQEQKQTLLQSIT